MVGKPLKLFISYSHEDEVLKDRLRQQLAAMEKTGLVQIWDDRAIPAGGHWEQAIRDQLEAAHLLLLLVSPSFINSDYCYGEEMSRAVQRHASGQARLVPVLLRPCQWELLPFIDEHKIQMLPRDAKAVTDPSHWPVDSKHDLPLRQVANELLQLVRDLQGAATGPVAASAASPPPPAASGRVEIPRLLPDLCNRGDQDTAFDMALRASQARPQRRPFVFVLFGEDAERLHGFRERLALVRIPRVLNLDREQTSVDCLTLDTPAVAVYGGDVAAAFQAELANKLLDDRGKTSEELLAYLGAHQRPLLLVSHFVGREGLDKLRKVAAGMLGFWNQWPDLPTGRTLLHCLSVRFERSADATKDAAKNATKNSTQDSSADAAAHSQHEDTRRLLRRLTARDGSFKDHPLVAGGVLPELGSVQRHHVEEWAELREVQKFSRIQPEDVATLFQSHPHRKADGSIPMEPLYADMAQLAQQRRC